MATAAATFERMGEPIRAELFGVERLEQHARSLANAQVTSGRRGRLGLISRRLAENGDVLLATYRELSKAIRAEALLTPAAEWLVDNFHLVEGQLREIRESLPPAYYRELPKLKGGHLANYPRVYGIAWAYVAHLDSRFDPDALHRFVAAYQEVEPLTIGELWAFPITLRLVMVENLRRLADMIVQGRRQRRAADVIADGLLGLNGGRSDVALVALQRYETGALPQPFVVQLIQRLRDHDPQTTPGLTWVFDRLSADGKTSDEVVNETHHRQSTTNVTVRNIITSLRHITSYDWAEFVEGVSLVDRAFVAAGGTYEEMSFSTRDRYRHAIENLAKGSGVSELKVAEATIDIAGEAAADRRQSEPGFYLLGEGRRVLEKQIGFRPGIRLLASRLARAHPASTYLGAILVGTFATLAWPLTTIHDWWPGRMLMALLAFIPASEVAVTVVNRMVAAFVRPEELPSLGLRHGPTDDLRTLIAIPAMLTRPGQAEELVERLEVHYLANPEGEFHFALLTDWGDAEAEHVEDDQDLLAAAIAGVARLNKRHGTTSPGGDDRFLLFHRRRLYNPAEGHYMGWERKRGKLHELNRLLRGATDTSFVPTGSEPPGAIRYVIALDADSRLPPGAATRLVATIAHPLNRARVDEPLGRVVQGYGILQPRVTAFLGGGGSSFFQRVFYPPAGIDPYAAAVSDVYQDLFGEGSYAGKGIYDVDAFEVALEDRIPENSLLSHDLFEGSFARAGLASNIEVFEEFPSHYEVALSRQHRWVRGDWQLLPWILGLRGPLPPGARLKMFDNLRRSLSAPASLFTLLASFVVPGVGVLPWTILVLTAMVLPGLLPLLQRMIPRRTSTPGAVRLRRWWVDAWRALGRILLQASFLAHQALRLTDAIVVTLWRIAVSRRGMLTWVTAEESERQFSLDRIGFVERMGPAMVVGLAATGGAGFVKPQAFLAALAWAIMWVLGPFVAHAASIVRPQRLVDPASPDDQESLRLVARQTWRYFERFVNDHNNWLPPDNYQEDLAVVAHRTSPTNIGLYLLAVLSAREFGWIGREDTITRLEATFATIDRLERFQGHLLNWYDTQTLEPLTPRYVSTVDSGNLAGHLLAVAEGCARLEAMPFGQEALTGIRDTALLIRETADRLGPRLHAEIVTARDLDRALVDLLGPIRHPSTGGWSERALETTETVGDIARTLAMSPGAEELAYWADALIATTKSYASDRMISEDPALSDRLAGRLASLAERAAALSEAMDFTFLLNQENKLLAVGYRVGDSALDQSHYDLLASEARLASFVGIAKGDLPPAHWFRLGRSMTPLGADAALISWSGSMFEYLMPLLVMRSPPESILDMTYRTVVQRQIQYGEERHVPWGISEAGYSARDVGLVYQYRAFGVPGLGFERGLSEDLVVAPYASVLAAMVAPGKAVDNLARLEKLGVGGAYGFYESIDFTPARLPESGAPVLVHAYMAHHQAMSIVAIANVVFGGMARTWFHSDPSVRGAELLLHERVPRDVEVSRPRAEEVAEASRPVAEARGVVRRVASPHGPAPLTQLLSNGRLGTVVTSAGSGYTRVGGIAINRWREDSTRDVFGTYLFLKDETGRTWSAGYQPTRAAPDAYQVAFSEDKVEISRRDGNIGTTLTVVVSEEDDAEIRRVSLANLGTTIREIEVTSYTELVLAPQKADDSHPAFSNLFVQTEAVIGHDALLATRRARSADEETWWAGHMLAVTGEVVGGAQYETDRARFLGRGNEIHRAAAIDRPLSNSVGRVLDPIFSLRRRVRIQPGATAHFDFTTVVAHTRDEVLDLVDKFSDAGVFHRTLTLAWTQAQVRLNHLRIEPEQAHIFQQLAGSLIYFDPARHHRPDRTPLPAGGPAGLWSHSISGDLPIVLVRIDQPEERGLVRDLLRAQEYWRMKGLHADLVIINEKPGSYAHDLQDAIGELIRERGRQEGQAADGGVFVLAGPELTPDDRAALMWSARTILLSHHGTLADQLARRPLAGGGTRTPRPSDVTPPPSSPQPTPDLNLEFQNGLGGFTPDGMEYVIVLGEGQWSPAPWINVVANPRFGFCVSEAGSGYSWSENSRQNQLTPWSNDPVADPPGEVIYVRDEETGEIWGPTALPMRDRQSSYLARHGPGFSSFDHTSHGIALNLHQTVPLHDPVKVSLLRLRNISGRRRRLSVTAYVEWVLGTTRSMSPMQIVTERDETTGAYFATNAWNLDFGGRVAFADMGRGEVTGTADRAEFLGRHGSIDRPLALQRTRGLSGRAGSGLDPCVAIQRRLTMAPDEEVEFAFLLGQGRDHAEARDLVERYRRADFDSMRGMVAQHWSDVLGALKVQTPDRSFDLMINRWLLYQTLACRVLARSAFYQSGGAYGFRDQLQDVMALVVPMRDVAREHLTRAASHQFLEGDVLHWWHEPSGRGVRTRISDDYLWLPYAVAHYVEVSGDIGLLDQTAPYVRGPALEEGQDEIYFLPERTELEENLFDHCRRALDRAISMLGNRGLPLIGTGDWNDGFNRVGREGKGESVWLGWFLEANLRTFAEIASRRRKATLAARWRKASEALKESLEAEAWDGDWYRRAFFDDGTPLGSSANPECRIDSIAQSWSVIHGGSPSDRAERAMASVEEYLVRRGDGLVLLFTPPFDNWDVDPGYIKGYLPGVRENGGQYTHAAIWCVIAFATLGDGDRAGELFGLLNPINHASTRAGIHRYRVEPYVAAADVYSEQPHVGRGGWTWYTGSAGWMYRAGVEWILGFRLRGNHLVIDPCIPRAWRGFEISFRYHSSRYEIEVNNPNGASKGVIGVTLDEVDLEPGADLELDDDGNTHHVKVTMG
ncbi:MAG: GH36-type glycosyl hydrolase domain-containing protein [Actinomycetota bacterium]